MAKKAQETSIERADRKLQALLDFVSETKDQRVIVAGTTMRLPFQRLFHSVERVQAYLDQVAAIPEVHGRWSQAYRPIVVRTSSKVSKPRYRRKKALLLLPASASSYRELAVLHQYAHHLSRDDHGPQFLAAYRNLLNICSSAEAAMTMSVCWLDEGLIA